jgi:hypothetical protein
MDGGLGATNDWKALVDVLGDLLGNRIGVTEACRTIADLGRTLGEGDNDLFLPFVGFDSETDSFPLGQVRERWASTVLRAQDEERIRYEELCRPWLLDAARKLLEYASRHAL